VNTRQAIPNQGLQQVRNITAAEVEAEILIRAQIPIIQGLAVHPTHTPDPLKAQIQPEAMQPTAVPQLVQALHTADPQQVQDRLTADRQALRAQVIAGLRAAAIQVTADPLHRAAVIRATAGRLLPRPTAVQAIAADQAHPEAAPATAADQAHQEADLLQAHREAAVAPEAPDLPPHPLAEGN